MDAKTEKIALFRYGLIVPLVSEVLPRGELTRRAEGIAEHTYAMPYSRRRSVSVDTLRDWATRYRQGGLAALAPQTRRDRGQSRVITPQLAELIDRLKRQNPHFSVAAMQKELARASDFSSVSLATLYRFLKKRGLGRQPLGTPRSKNFEAELSNQIWQMYIMLGPCVQHQAGGQRQAFLFAFMDSASRLIPHAQFYTSQASNVMLDCLRQAIAVRGLPLRLDVDNCKLYQNQQVVHIANTLGISLIHTRHQPEERAKIERCFRCIPAECLANLGDPKMGLTLQELNERLWNWIDNVYNRRELSSLETSPLMRWQRDIKHVRRLPPTIDLRSLFVYRLDRTAGLHSTAILQERSDETPPNIIGPATELRFEPVDAAEICLNGQSQGPPPARPLNDTKIPSAKPKPNVQPIAATPTSSDLSTGRNRR
jgi:transposase